ncbi:hypothetical protein GCM10012280_48940 [Wenjunlia tyrosinilytica]|uniref:Uncharacterized protein n=1 Tax=Wenjunlia tyrosinilytica TaxID=1544741 RepID=A0A917ZVG0_9ACTN|nr:hypothetical protein GCM10012280_48940 [Wenjunlia tyrosinilytica]
MPSATSTDTHHILTERQHFADEMQQVSLPGGRAPSAATCNGALAPGGSAVG